MKPILLFALSLFYFQLGAQITLNQGDLPMVGQTYTTITDTFAIGINVGMAGPDQIWDFTSLQTHTMTSTTWLAASDAPGAADFPEATIASNFGVGFNFLETNALALINHGIATDPFDSGEYIIAKFEPTEIVFNIPSTYGDAFSDTYAYDVKADGSVLNFDSIRLKQINSADVEIDAYGSLTTPEGTFDVLRLRRTTTTIDSIWVEVPIFGEQLAQIQEGTTTTLEWLAKGIGGVVASVDLDADGLPIRATYYTTNVVVQVPEADYYFSENSIETNITIDFTDNSSNSPTGWFWDFGDGSTSSEQNPTHIYTENGYYTVCLTVTNEAGSDTHCMEYIFTISPVVTFTTEEVDNGVYQFTDMTSQNPTSWVWTFGDGETSTEQNPEHTYSESGIYEVCLSADNGFEEGNACQTIDVIISSTESIKNEPFVEIFPNPATDFINIKTALNTPKIITLTIVDALGNIVSHYSPKAAIDIQINTSFWGNGLYFYHICNEQGLTFERGQIIVQK